MWENINNLNFNRIEFDAVKFEVGLNSFTLSPSQWIEKTNAVGLITKAGRYSSGTFAHKDIAIEFASWISVEFKLFLIKEFQRLKEKETKENKQEWNLRRSITKINYDLHTNAIKENLIPKELSINDAKRIYASEADLLNLALFGQTAQEFKENNLNIEGNLRDNANIIQLVCLSNLESLNSIYIQEDLSSEDRMIKLNKVAIKQMSILVQNSKKLLKN